MRMEPSAVQSWEEELNILGHLIALMKSVKNLHTDAKGHAQDRKGNPPRKLLLKAATHQTLTQITSVIHPAQERQPVSVDGDHNMIEKKYIYF